MSVSLFIIPCFFFFFFFFNDTATTEIYTLSLHDALPISARPRSTPSSSACSTGAAGSSTPRSEEHTSELQSLAYLVCRLLLEKKKTQLWEMLLKKKKTKKKKKKNTHAMN